MFRHWLPSPSPPFVSFSQLPSQLNPSSRIVRGVHVTLCIPWPATTDSRQSCLFRLDGYLSSGRGQYESRRSRRCILSLLKHPTPTEARCGANLEATPQQPATRLATRPVSSTSPGNLPGKGGHSVRPAAPKLQRRPAEFFNLTGPYGRRPSPKRAEARLPWVGGKNNTEVLLVQPQLPGMPPGKGN